MVTLIANVDVDDLEKGIAFYERALGLRLGRRLLGGTVAEMLGAASPIMLLEKPAGSAAHAGVAPGEAVPARDYRRHWTPVHLDFVVADVAAAAARAQAAGAGLEGGIQTFAWGRMAVLNDPFGHGFCLLELAQGGYDA
jgi:predicted enzyme related to lactoylglutathione lyase